MGLGRDITVILGLEARAKGLEVIERFTHNFDKMSQSFQTAGRQAELSGSALSDTFISAGAAQEIAEAGIDKVTLAVERLRIAEENLKVASSAANSATVEGMQKQIVAADAVVKASHDVAIAKEEEAVASQRAKTALDKEDIAAGKLNKSHGNLLDTITKHGQAAAFVTATIGGFAYSAANAAMKYNEFTVSIANAGNTSVETAKKTTDAFLNMSMSSKYSASDLSGAYAKVVGQLSLLNNGALSTQDAVKFMKASQDAAAASGENLGSVTKNLSDLMQKYHVPVADAAKVSGYLFNASRLTGQSMAQTANMIGRTKTVLGSVAPPIKDVATLMVDLAQNGQSGRMAVSTLAQMMNKLIQQGRASTPTLQEVNNAILHLPTSIQGLARAYVNGKVSAAEFQKQMKKMQVTDPIAAGYLKQFESLRTKSKQSEETLNALRTTPAQNEMSKLGLHLFDASGKFVGLGSAIEQLSPKLRAMGSEQERLRVTQLLFGSANKKVLDLIMAGKDGWDKATQAIKDQRAEQEAAKRAQETYEASVAKLKNTFSALQISLGNAFIPIIEKLMSTVAKFLPKIVTFIQHNKTLIGIIAAVVVSITSLITVLWAGQKAVNALKNGFNTFKTVIEGVSKLGTKIIGFFTETVIAEEGTTLATEGATAGFTGLAASIWATLAPILAVIAVIAALIAIIWVLWKYWRQIWHFIVEFVKGAATDIKNFFFDLIHVIQHLPGIIWGFISSLPGKMFQLGKDMILKLIHGIGSMAGQLISSVHHLIGKIPVIGGLLSSGMSLLGKFNIFHNGGVVQGSPGENVPAILQAGETVLTAQQTKRLSAAGNVPLRRTQMQGGGHSVVVNVHVNGQVYGSLNDFSNKLGRHLTTTVLPQAGVNLAH